MSAVVVTAKDIAAYLAKNPRGKRRKNKAVSSSEDAADVFIRDFSAKHLYEILVDKRKRRINTEWIVKELLSIYHSTEKDATKVQILDRLQEFIVLGAVQDPEIIKEIKSTAGQFQSKARKAADPFIPKLVKGA